MGCQITMAGSGFGHVLDAVGKGAKACRREWPEEILFIQVRAPVPSGLVTKPWLMVHDVHGDVYPWTPTQEDLLAQDWQILP